MDKLLTGWRAGQVWLRAGSSVAQQQVIREFSASRAKALKDVRERVPQRRRAGMPRFKKRSLAVPTLKNSAAVMLVRAGLNPVGDDGTRPVRPPDEQAA
ncbi:hypothetical protein ACSHWB_23695 [Lentzea sp. HUAS TT2]|uniref:hypothetical protein n=1 Tax=Lentzea sp. HUAS TT2 TaxID=3447454 RepID=UPI003F7180F9